jgi:hypothetical protein
VPERPPDPDPDLLLAAEALELAPNALELISREPLGHGTVTGFRVAAADGAFAYVDASLLPVRAETGLVQEGVARLWLHPADPHLPALAPAAYGNALAVLLARLGIEGGGAPVLVAYRPGRRAVLSVPADAATVWVKVVRPTRVARIVASHDVLGAAGIPVPPVRGWSPDGLLVLGAAAGMPALDADVAPERLLDEVDSLRAGLAGAPLAEPARTSVLARTPWYTERLAAALPSLGADLDGIRAAAEHSGAGSATVGIHGDLHLGQLFVGPDGTITGVIDVDTAGRGDPADDGAAFIGHAVASAILTERVRDASGVWALADRAWERWGADAGVRPLTAVQLLGHAVAAVHTGEPVRARRLVRLAAMLVRGHKGPLMNAFETA